MPVTPEIQATDCAYTILAVSRGDSYLDRVHSNRCESGWFAIVRTVRTSPARGRGMTSTAKKWIIGAAAAGAMIGSAGIAAAATGSGSTPTPSVSSQAPKSNEDATHEKGESTTREADEAAGRAGFGEHGPGGHDGHSNTDPAHEAGESKERQAEEATRDAQGSSTGSTGSTGSTDAPTPSN